MTNEVIERMKITKKFLEQNYKCKASYANYVLFKKENKFTNIFGFQKVGDHFRMALTDMKTLNKVKN
jgi:hypothetical protein